mmetsp:Transcript_123036/g.244895  ORF Transcript_123036/g.244895 Transcript_123036/m.244895 type:complete len:204 (+) Transcript_123036:738-1349(+)
MYSSASSTAHSSVSKSRTSRARPSHISEPSIAAKTGDAAARTARCAGNRRSPHRTSTSVKSRVHQSCCVRRCRWAVFCAGDVFGSATMKRTACTTRWFSSPWLQINVNLHRRLRNDIPTACVCHSGVRKAFQVLSFCHASPTCASKDNFATPMPSPRSFHSSMSTTWPWSSSKTKAWSRTWPGNEAQYSTDLALAKCEASWFI